MDVIRSRLVLRERPLLDVADLALRFVAANAARYARLSAVVILPALLASCVVSWAFGWWVGWSATVAMTALAGAPFVALASRLVFADETTVREALRVAGRSLPALAVLRMAQLAALLIGTALFVVPGVFMASITLFVVEVQLLEQTGRVPLTFRRAQRVARGRPGTAVIAALLCAAAPIAAAMIADVAGREFLEGMLEVSTPPPMFVSGGSWLALCGWWSALPLLSTTRFFLYLDSRTRTEGWDIQTRFAAIAAREQAREAARIPPSLRPPAAALALFVAFTALSAPRSAAAAVDPSRAGADVAAIVDGAGYSFCRQPHEPLSRRARNLCGHASLIPNCDGLAAACARSDGLRQRSRSEDEGASFPSVAALARAAVWLLVALVLGAVLFPIARAIAQRPRRAPNPPGRNPPTSIQQDIDGHVERHADAESLLAQAEAEARDGRATAALELYLGASLRALHERGTIRISKDRTNGEYVRSCADGSVRPTLAALVRDVEQVKFGGRDASPDVLTHAAKRASAIVRAISIAMTVALVVGVSGCGRQGRQPGDDPAGDEIWTEVLRRQGFDVQSLNEALASLPIPDPSDDSGAIVVDTTLTELDKPAQDRLRDWVDAGGALVLLGEPDSWPAAFRPRAGSRGKPDRVSVPFGPGIEHARLEHVQAMDGLPEATQTVASIGTGPGIYAAYFSFGRGSVLEIASDELLTNVALTRGGNAAALVAIFLANRRHGTARCSGGRRRHAPVDTDLRALARRLGHGYLARARSIPRLVPRRGHAIDPPQAGASPGASAFRGTRAGGGRALRSRGCGAAGAQLLRSLRAGAPPGAHAPEVGGRPIVLGDAHATPPGRVHSPLETCFGGEPRHGRPGGRRAGGPRRARRGLLRNDERERLRRVTQVDTTAFQQTFSRIVQQMARVVVGQDKLVEGALVAALANGHVLIEGAPGLGKTLVARALGVVSGCAFKRIQFTPDLMPSDITGSSVYSRQTGEFNFLSGPVFAQLLLADEINRAPAKTQSALLEAMQDHQVTVDGTSRPLPMPFVVMATQNPVESQGTYPLPEAQLDRFLFKLTVNDPPAEGERLIVRNHASGFDPTDLSALAPVTSPIELVAMQQHARGVRVDDAVIAYIVEIVRRTREDAAIDLGASPRASIALLKAAQVIAASSGRAFVTPDDVKPMVLGVLRHRVILHPDAQLQGVSADERIAEILRSVPVPRLAA